MVPRRRAGTVWNGRLYVVLSRNSFASKCKVEFYGHTQGERKEEPGIATAAAKTNAKNVL